MVVHPNYLVVYRVADRIIVHRPERAARAAMLSKMNHERATSRDSSSDVALHARHLPLLVFPTP
jgi:hypothetical protein